MSNVPDGSTIVVWFSCGAASAVAAMLTLQKYNNCKVRIVNNPVAEELEDNRRFLKDVEKWLGVEIELSVNPKYPDASCQQVWEERRYMSGPQGAPCTLELKKRARQHWESNNRHDYLVLGFTAEESKRAERFRLFERENLITPLIDEGLTKQDCFNVVTASGIRLPEAYLLGYPNANCIGCVKSKSSTYWNHVRVHHPDVFNKRAKTSREVGCRLVWYKGKRIFLDELPEDARGHKLKKFKTDCGIFCEED